MNEVLPTPAVIKDSEFSILHANRPYLEIVGQRASDVVGRYEETLFPPELAVEFRAQDEQVLDTGQPVTGEFELTRPDGVNSHFRVVRMPLTEADERVWGTTTFLMDISAERELARQLAERTAQLEELARWTPGMLYQFRSHPDGHFDMPYASPGIRTVFEVNPEDVVDDVSPIFERVHPEDYLGFVASITESEESLSPWEYEFRMQLPEAGLRWIRAHSQPERIGDLTVWRGFAEDITERKETEHAVWYRANFDLLTGLPNRSLALDRLEQALRRSRRDDSRIYVLFCDLNGFKAINDAYGHQVGDLVLQEAGRRLLATVREIDTVSRYGGDEFLILLPELTRKGLTRVLAGIQSALRRPFVVGEDTMRLRGASIGVATSPKDGTDPETLISVADHRMYAEKTSRV